MTQEESLHYFERAPKSLEILETNKQAWAFEHRRGVWRIGEDAGFSFERLDSCGILREAVWVSTSQSISEWDFKLTYRKSLDQAGK